MGRFPFSIFQKLRAYYQFIHKYNAGWCWLPIVRHYYKKKLHQTPFVRETICGEEGILYELDGANPICRYILQHGFYGDDLLWAIRNYTELGSIVVDVGANLGFMSILMSKYCGSKGRVYVIEPNSYLHPYIHRLFWLNQKSNYTLLSCACSDREGVGSFWINPEDHTQSKLVNSQQNQVIQVELRSLDNILRDTDQRVSLIKIDTEGHELEVLKGAQHVISVNRPVIILEVGTHSSETVQQMEQLFKQLRYEFLGVLHPGGILPISFHETLLLKRHANGLFLPLPAGGNGRGGESSPF